MTSVALTLGFLPLMGGVAHAIPSTFSINDVIVSEEAGTATFTVTRAGDTTEAASVTYETVQLAGTTAATAGEDYTTVAPTELTFAAGVATRQVTVPIIDDAIVDEPRVERFQVRLTAPTPTGDDTIADPTGIGEIVNDDGPSQLSIRNASVVEGDTGTVNMVFTAIRSGDPTAGVSATFTTTDGTAVAPDDYATTTGTVSFGAGDVSDTAVVPVNGDLTPEPDETFTVTLSEPTAGTTVVDQGAQGTIVNDDEASNLSIGDVSVIEGDTGTVEAVFTVTRTGGDTPASATYTIAPGTATAGVDYDNTPATGTVAFNATETSKTIIVPVLTDDLVEPDETFTVTLSAPTGSAVIQDATGTGTIVDDDGSRLSVNDVTVTEGNAGTTNAVFTVTRTGVTTGDAGATFTTSNATATAGSDYTATTTTVTFTGTETTKTVTVPVIGDTADEADEVFIVTLSAPTGQAVLDGAEATGTIIDDDPAVQPAGVQGYTLVASDGGIFNFGNSRFFGSTGAIRLNQPVVGMDHTPTTQGYWLVAADGGIFAFGDAKFFGSTGAIKLNKPIVGMRSTPTGNGYWLVASDGGIFAFGDAKFFGSTGAIRLNQPIVGMERTPSGNGYWLVASDGGIFAFGDAKFFGSTGAIRLNLPVVGMARTNTGDGYFLVASDGGIFAFGDAVFRGSTGAIRLNSPVTGMMPTATGTGYWLCARDGGVFAFGNAQFLGSMGATRLNQPVVGCDAPLAQAQFG